RRPPISPLFPYTTLFRSGVAARFEVFPLDDELEVGDRLFHPHDAGRRAFALNLAVVEGPGVGVTVDVEEVVFAERAPAGAGAVEDRKSTRLNSSHDQISY